MQFLPAYELKGTFVAELNYSTGGQKIDWRIKKKNQLGVSVQMDHSNQLLK